MTHMECYLNKAMVIGILRDEPIFKTIQTKNGEKSFCSIVLDSHHRKNTKNHLEYTLSYSETHLAVAWNQLADLIHAVAHRGNLVYIEGVMRTKTEYSGGELKNHRVEILVSKFMLLKK